MTGNGRERERERERVVTVSEQSKEIDFLPFCSMVS